jgi:hypothetical protein
MINQTHNHKLTRKKMELFVDGTPLSVAALLALQLAPIPNIKIVSVPKDGAKGEVE